MRTARLLTVSPSMHSLRGVPGPGGCVPDLGCVPGPGGCTWSEGCTWSRGGVPGLGECTWLGGFLVQGVYLVWGSVPGPRGCAPGLGVYLVPGGCTWSQVGGPAQVLPPPVNRMIDRCKNITLPQTSFAGGNNMVCTPPMGNRRSATD